MNHLFQPHRCTPTSLPPPLRPQPELVDLQQALQTSRARLAALTASPLFGAFECDSAGTIRFASQRMGQLCDFAPQALIGRNWLDCLHSTEANTREQWEALRDRAGGGQINGRFGRPGVTRQLRIHFTPIEAASGGYMASIEDSSSAFAAEQARRRSEERLNQVIELMPENPLHRWPDHRPQCSLGGNHGLAASAFDRTDDNRAGFMERQQRARGHPRPARQKRQTDRLSRRAAQTGRISRPYGTEHVADRTGARCSAAIGDA